MSHFQWNATCLTPLKSPEIEPAVHLTCQQPPDHRLCGLSAFWLCSVSLPWAQVEYRSFAMGKVISNARMSLSRLILFCSDGCSPSCPCPGFPKEVQLKSLPKSSVSHFFCPKPCPLSTASFRVCAFCLEVESRCRPLLLRPEGSNPLTHNGRPLKHRQQLLLGVFPPFALFLCMSMWIIPVLSVCRFPPRGD